ncbi:unnamed protein product [Cuscuta epithymum]|uniref:Putative plant transposon protein domain-containing protein n=1 Tax=Cuscuta epithymum TaxID=186058 RepID=A0AAV0G6I1_9ASTE|nr:unnamed protein product [Cuscuta epithymum]CAH9137584.1 unnamed protein product [Cuscuta epithymum]CAH9143182.1 unnamed protein product [Cuscuta epithymum]
MAPKRKQNTGASSSSFTGNRFTSVENEKWYEERKKWKIVEEKTVHPDIDAVFKLTEIFARFGWAMMLTLTGAYYPRLVREFYANVSDKETGYAEIQTTVKGRHIKVDPDLLSNILEVSNTGPTLEYNQTGILSDNSYNEADARRFFGLKTNLQTKYLWHIHARLLVYLIGFNIVPHASDRHLVRRIDLYLLQKMLVGLGDIEGIPLPRLLLKNMKNVVISKQGSKNFCHPLLLTKIFRHFQVDFDGEEVAYTNESNVLDKETMIALKHKLSNSGKWYFADGIGLHRDDDEVNEEAMEDAHDDEAAPEPPQPPHTTDPAMAYLMHSMARMHTRMDEQEARHQRFEERFDTFTNYYYSQHGYPPPDPHQ